MLAKKFSIKGQQLIVAGQVVSPVAFKTALSLGLQARAQTCEQAEGLFADRRRAMTISTCGRRIAGRGLESG